VQCTVCTPESSASNVCRVHVHVTYQMWCNTSAVGVFYPLEHPTKMILKVYNSFSSPEGILSVTEQNWS